LDEGLFFNDRLLDLRYVRLCNEIEILEMNLCAIGGFMLLVLVSLVVPMANFHEEETNLPVRRSSTRTLFSTPIVLDDDTCLAVQNVVTLIT
jgi:hypothetical protein